MSNISSIQGLGGLRPQGMQDKAKAAGVQDTSFKDTLGDMLGGVNDAMVEAGKGASRLASGEVTDIHQVMVAAEKAAVGLEMVVEIRNKLLESYQTIMRTQI